MTLKIMNRSLPVACILSLFLTACNDTPSTDVEAMQSSTPAADKILKPSPAEAEENNPAPLELGVTDHLMEEVMAPNPEKIPPQAASNTQPLNLNAAPSESRVKLKGQVFLDDNWQQDYRQAIDGGRVDIEVKFEE